MQTEEILEEIIVGSLPWYRRILPTQDWVVVALFATALAFGILAWRQRQGKPWIGWMLVLTSIPAVISFFAPFELDGFFGHPIRALLDTDETIYARLRFAGPYLSSVVLLIWKLRLLTCRPVARSTVLIAVGLLALVIISDLYLLLQARDAWPFIYVSLHVFVIAGVGSIALTAFVLLNRISPAASVSSLLMMIFAVHSALAFSWLWDKYDYVSLGSGFYTSLMAISIFAAEIGYTIVRDWGSDRYWVWEADQESQ